MGRASNKISPAEYADLQKVGWKASSVVVTRGVEHINLVRRKRIRSVVVESTA